MCIKNKSFFHLKSRLRARSARWFFKRCYRFIFFLFLIHKFNRTRHDTDAWDAKRLDWIFHTFCATENAQKHRSSNKQQASKQNIIFEFLKFDSIRILSPACRFFGCNKILIFQHKSDTPVTRSGSISKSKYLEFEQIRILSQVSRFFVCSNSRFSTNKSKQNPDLVTGVWLFRVL